MPFIVGFVIMSLATLAIHAKGAKAPPLGTHTAFHATVTFIAATAYLAMAMFMGVVLKMDGTVTLVPRYLDWSFTTPILLAGLVLTALHGRRGEAAGYMVSIIALDVLMIVTGLLASLAVMPIAKLVWFLWSTAAFLGVLWILWKPLATISRAGGGATDLAYRRNLSFLTVVWILYPVAFAVGPEGLRFLSPDGSSWLFLLLDVVAKVIYAFYAAANLDRALRTEQA